MNLITTKKLDRVYLELNATIILSKISPMYDHTAVKLTKQILIDKC